jgi:hypothetical protein
LAVFWKVIKAFTPTDFGSWSATGRRRIEVLLHGFLLEFILHLVRGRNVKKGYLLNFYEFIFFVKKKTPAKAQTQPA